MSASDLEMDDIPLAVPIDEDGPGAAVAAAAQAARVAGDSAGDAAAVDSGLSSAAGEGAGEALSASAPARTPTPVTLITGYLGSGKTTLVNQILTSRQGIRCAVLLNEIGESADVERALVREPEGGLPASLSSWVELENGCICCSAKTDMVLALESLLQQRERFDAVLIEGTGLASPGPVAAELWPDRGLAALACLDAIVAVVDARNFLRQLQEREGDDEDAKGAGSGEKGAGVHLASGSGAHSGAPLLSPHDGAAGSAVSSAASQPHLVPISPLNPRAQLPPETLAPDAEISPAARQVAYADVVIVNKLDLVSKAQGDDVVRAVRAINGAAKVLTSVRCEVDLRNVLNTGLYAAPKSGKGLFGELFEHSEAGQHDHGHDGEEHHSHGHDHDDEGHHAHDHGHGHGNEGHHAHNHDHDGAGHCQVCKGHDHDHDGHAHGHRHDHGAHSHQHGDPHSHSVGTVTLRTPRPVDLEAFRTFLESLLWTDRSPPRPDVYRAKALLRVPCEAGTDPQSPAGDGYRWVVVQSVHDLYDVVDANAEQEGARGSSKGLSKCVLIGKRLDRETLEREFLCCAIDDEDKRVE